MEFKGYKLGDVIEFKNGKKRNQKVGQYPVYGGNGIIDYEDKFNTEGTTLIIGRVGAYCGSIYKHLGKCWVSDNAIIGKVKEEFSSDFIYYLLLNMNLNRLHIGSSHPLLTQDILNTIESKIPSLENQNKIAKILSDIDKKIELNKQMYNNLHEIISEMFTKFLNSYSNSDLVSIKDAVEKIGTGADAIKSAPIVDYDTGIRCIRVGDMTNNRTPYEWGFTKMSEKDFNNYKLDVGDIVVTRTAVNGLAYLIEDDIKVVCNNGLIKMKINNKYNSLFIYLLLKTKDFYNYVHRIDGETSVRPNMKVNYLTSYKFHSVPLEEQNNFCKKIIPMREKQKEIIDENAILIKLRDILLPKLMNGEINVEKVSI